MNKEQTCANVGTNLTQPGSADVHGYTYFIRSGERIKIGHTAKFKRRLRGLQSANGEPLVVLAVVPGSIIEEFQAHQLFAHLRVHGEWFQADRELLCFIDEIKAEAADLPATPDPLLSAEAVAMIGRLIKVRVAHGADTAMGYACSNLAEQIKAMASYKRPAWATDERQTLPYLMGLQMKRIEDLTKRLA